MLKSFDTELDRAQYTTVHKYRARNGVRGAEALSTPVGVQAWKLDNKVNPRFAGTHLSIFEAIRLQLHTENYSIHHAMSEELGFAAVPLGDYELVTDEQLFSIYTQLHAKAGKASDHLHESLKDGHVSQHEFNEFQRLNRDVIRCRLELEHRLETRVDDDRPRLTSVERD